MGFEGTIQAIAEQIALTLSATKCTIRVPRGNKLWLMASYGADAESRPKEVDINESTIAGKAFISGQLVHVPDITTDPRYDLQYVQDNNPKEVAALPIILDGVNYGVIQIYRKKGFSRRQIRFANILAQIAGPALYKIETSKRSRQAILDVFDSIFESKTFDEMSIRAVEIISERLEVPSCLIYRILKKGGEAWCKIVAGVPDGAHKIGWEDKIDNQPHIACVVNEKKQLIIDDPLNDPKTERLNDIVQKKGINSILLIPLVSKKKGNNERIELVIGVLVLDACKEKKNFSAEERSFASDGGKMITRFLDRDEMTLKEFEHRVKNPNVSMGGLAKRLSEPLTEIYEISENVCKKSLQTCSGAAGMCENAPKVIPRATRIEVEAHKIDAQFTGLGEIN